MKSVLKKSAFLLFFSLFFLLFKTSSDAAELRPTGDVNSFTEQMKLTTVMIDVNILTTTHPEPIIYNEKFQAYSGQAGNDNFDNAVIYKSITKKDIGERLLNPGICFQYLYENAATLPNGTKADLLITYSDVNLYVSAYKASPNQTNPSSEGSANPNGFVVVANGNKLDTVPQEVGNTSNSWYVGVEETVKAQVVHAGTTTPVSDEDMLFWMYGLTVPRGIKRTDANGQIEWYADTNNYNRIPYAKPDKYGWSEQAEFSKSGLVDDIYYPAEGYIAAIAKLDSDRVLFYGNGAGDTTYLTGFATAADAGAGAVITYRVGVGWNRGTQDIHNSIWPTKFTHSILSSSGNGGSIWTNKNGDGTGAEFPGGKWTGSEVPLPNNYDPGGANLGDDQNGHPLMYVVPDRKSKVVYTMAPESGYVIDKLYINGEEVTPPTRNSDGTYTYTFGWGEANRSIHVTWKQVVDLTVTKTWDDGNDANRPKSIDIQLYQNVNGVKTTYNGVINLKADENGKWSHTFRALPKTDENGNKITYSVEEILPPGMEDTYDVTLPEPAESGTLTITNKKILSAELPVVVKTIEGPNLDDLDDTYTFTLNALDGAPMPKDYVPPLSIHVGDSPREKGFGKVVFPGPGTYSYVIEEQADESKYSVSPKQYTVTYTVDASGLTGFRILKDGTEYSTEYSADGNPVPFNNQYSFEPGVSEPYVYKKITGIATGSETFNFEMECDPADAPMPAGAANGKKVISVTGNGQAGFGPVTFTCESDEDCVYTYTIRELTPSNPTPGLKYDDKVYTIEMTIDHVTGDISKQFWITENGVKKEIDHSDSNVYDFENAYPGSQATAEPKVSKTIIDGTPGEGDKFYFLLEAVEKPAEVEVFPMPDNFPGTSRELMFDYDDYSHDRSESFGTITFPAPGKYTYKIRELGKADLGSDQYLPNYEYDSNYYLITYTVSINNEGQYVAVPNTTDASGTSSSSDAVIFSNRLKSGGVASDGIRVIKMVTPEGVIQDHPVSFSFTLTLEDAPKDLPQVPMPSAYEDQNLKCVYGNDPNKLTCTISGSVLNFYFGDMVFPVDGEYKYIVQEVSGTDSDFDYDGTVYHIVYDVSNGDFRSVITKDGGGYASDILYFTNTYTKADQEKVDVTVNKIWEDGGDANRPSSIQIQLYQTSAGEKTPTDGVITLFARNNWTHTYRDLPKRDKYGYEITYSVVEDFITRENYSEKQLTTTEGDVTTITIINTKNLTAELPLIWKTIEGPDQDSLDEVYTFKISALDGGPLPMNEWEEVVDTVTISSRDATPRRKGFDGKITFPGPGTYTYAVTEMADESRYTVTPKQYTLTYTVTESGLSTVIMSDDTPYEGRDLVFDNAYPWPKGTTEARVRKRIDGVQPDEPETYTFRLKRYTPDSPMPESVDHNGEIFVTITGEGTAGFDPVTFHCTGEKDCVYEYRIREVIPTGDKKREDVIYDDTEYHCYVTVDHITGEISKRVLVNGEEVPHNDNTYLFVNKYPDEMPTVEPAVRKVIPDGTPDPADKFYFLLEAVGKPDEVEVYPMPVLSNEDGMTKMIKIDGDDILADLPETFGKITFPAVGKYTYTIRELGEEDLEPAQYMPKYEYDDNFFTITYDVHVNDKGEIVTDTHVTNASGSTVHPDSTSQSGAVTFRNRMLPEGAGDDIHVEKVIISTGIETEQAATFSFTLTLNEAPEGLDKKPMPEEVDIQTLKCSYEGSNRNIFTCSMKGGSLHFFFGEIDFVKDGTYRYTVQEMPGTDTEFDYDNSVYQVIYEVKGGEVKRKITKDGADYDGSRVVFTNTYHKPQHTEMEAVVEKRISGGDPQPEDVFHFVLKAKDSKNPMPEGSSGTTKTIAIKASDEKLEKSFGQIKFEEVGVYSYEVQEVQDELDHYAYDPTVYTVTWTVSKEGKGSDAKLKTEKSIQMDGYREDERSGEKLIFENVYLDPNEVTLLVKKFVSGGTPLIRDYFRFALTGVSNTVEGLDHNPLPESCKDNVCNLDILGTSHKFFEKVALKEDGEYVYEVREVPGESEDYIYDSSVYTIKVTVVDGAKLKDYEILKDGVKVDGHDNAVSFENKYLKGADEKHPTIRKEIKGNPGRDDPFVFSIKVDPMSPQNPMPPGAKNGILEIEINGEGEMTFGTIAFEKPGKYVYTIREVDNGLGYKYDDTVYTVTFDVKENDTHDGTIAVRTIMKGGQPYDKNYYLFTNIWGDDEEGDGDGDGGSHDSVLPRTGFAPDVVTKLPKQRVNYSAYSQLRLRIPSLGIDSEILGIPKTDGDWDVSWLGDNVGWLQNTAWPGSVKAGNTVLTGHSYNYLGYPGVFANLDRLTYGCSISITAFGETFVYLVDNVQTVFADTPQVLSQKTDVPELTLITCKYYNAASNQYDGRVVVKAKLAEIR